MNFDVTFHHQGRQLQVWIASVQEALGFLLVLVSLAAVFERAHLLHSESPVPQLLDDAERVTCGALNRCKRSEPALCDEAIAHRGTFRDAEVLVRMSSRAFLTSQIVPIQKTHLKPSD